MEYEKKRGWNPRNVSRKRDFIGYDIISIGPGEKNRLIEVKGTAKKHGIPDMTETEFTRKLTMIATHLYVIGDIDKEPLLYIIPRKDIKPGAKTVNR